MDSFDEVQDGDEAVTAASQKYESVSGVLSPPEIPPPYRARYKDGFEGLDSPRTAIDILRQSPDEWVGRPLPEVSPDAQKSWNQFTQTDELENQVIVSSLSTRSDSPPGGKWREIAGYNKDSDLYSSINKGLTINS